MTRRSPILVAFTATLSIVISATFSAQSPQPDQNPSRRERPAARAAKQVEGELLVKFRRGTLAGDRAVAHRWTGAQRLRTFSVVPGLELVRLPANVSVKDAVALYRAHPDVVYAEPNYVVEAIQVPQATPNDPQFGVLWGLHNTGQAGGTPGADIDAPEAWNITTGSSAVVVAVIDTGTDYTHPDLAANMFQNTADCNANGIDDDGNGYIDDCYGIDTINNDSDPMDDAGHGTHTAGTIGAIGNNGLGVVGVNWNVRLMPCKFLGANGSGPTSAAIACLEYVKTMKDRGVNIVATNNSWGGGGYSQALYDAIDAQRQRGILFIASAGNAHADNDSAAVYPANYNLPNVISVAATTRTDDRAAFSNFGRRTVHLGAPGREILSTTPNNTYSTFNGTSMAAPHVSGVAALLKAADPSRDWRAIKNLILAGGDAIPSMANSITGRRLNAHGALTCSNSIATSPLLPAHSFVSATVNTPIPLAMLNINCANPNGPLTVAVSPGGSTITLVDDGSPGDQAADDGIYTGQFTPTAPQRYTLTFPGGDTVIVAFPASYNVTPAAYNYRTITGTNLNLLDDSAASITPPFPLHFGGIELPTLYVGGNGVLSAGDAITNYFNVPLPNPFVSAMVAPFWDDLYPNGSQNVYWDVVGTAPQRELVVEWRDVPAASCPTGGTLKFQTVFFEGSSDILFNYADTVVGGACAAADHGAQATIGVQVAPNRATQLGFAASVVADQMALLWTLQPVSADPVLSVIPNAMDFGSVGINGVADRTFTIQNIGGGTLTGTATTAAPFSIVSGAAFSLGPLAIQPLVVRFRPTAIGPASGAVSVTTNVSNTTAPITGTGTTGTLSIGSGPNFGTFSIGQVETPLSATGGDGTYAWSVVAGSLPPGISLRTDNPSSFPPTASAGLVGVATTPGLYTFTLRVASGNETADRACTLKITGLTMKDGNQFNYLPDAFVGAAYSYTLTALGAAGATTWTTTSALPAGVTLSTSGALAGTPAAAGSFVINLRLTDGVDTIFRTLTLLVSALNVATSAVLPNATQGATYATTITVTGGTPPYTFSGCCLPGGLTLSSAGTISGTVSASASPGPTFLSLRVTDSKNISYTKNMSIDVIAVQAAVPSIDFSTYGSFDDCTIGVKCSRGIAVRRGGTAPFTWSASGLPPGVSIRPGTGDQQSFVSRGTTWASQLFVGDAEIWGVPTATGDFSVQLTVTDAAGVTAGHVLPLKVSELVHPDQLTGAALNAAYARAIRVIGGTPPYTGTQVAGQLPAGLTFTPSTSLVSGTPIESGFFTAVFVFEDANHQTYRVWENLLLAGGGSNVAINNNGNLGTIGAGSVYSTQLFACCVASYTWSLVGGALPPGVVLTSGGLLNGTAITAGSYTFLIRATDAANSANFGQRQFTLNVVSPPVLTITTGATLPFGNMCTVYSKTLDATGGTGARTWTLAFGSYLPPGLTLAASGTISGSASVSGQYSFTVIVTDAAGHAAARTFNVSIYPGCDGPPVAQLQGPNFGTFSIGDVQISLSAAGGNGAYVWSVVAGSLPPGISLRTDNPPSFPVTASAGLVGVATTPGTYSFTLRAASGTQTADRACTLKVTALTVKDGSHFPNLPDAFAASAYEYTLTALNAAGPVTWTATSGLPAGATLSTAGLLAGTPTVPGSYSINFSVTDGVDTVSRRLTLVVNALSIIVDSVDGVLPNATQGLAYSTTLTATGGTPPYTFSGIPPNGLSLSPSGTISGTVTLAAGPSPFFVTVTDSRNVSYRKLLLLDVIGVPATLPSLSLYGNFDNCTIGVRCSRGISVRNGGTAPFTWTAIGLPPGMSVRPGTGSPNVVVAAGSASGFSVPAGDLEVWGVPTVTGAFNVTVTVTDAAGATATQTYPLKVSELLFSASLSGSINVAYSRTLRVVGGAPPYTGVRLAGDLPAGVTLDPITLLLSGTPLENGFFSPVFVFTDANDETLRVTETFMIAGGGTGLSIFPSGDLGSVAIGSGYSNQLSACCAASSIWSVIGGTLPPGLALSSSGLLQGTPTSAGSFTFLIKASDASNGANYGQRQLTLRVVSGPVLRITTGSTLPAGNESIPYSATLDATGGTGTLAWTLKPLNYLPPGLTLAANGVLSGTPIATGQYNFTLTVADGSSQNVARSFNVSIFPAPVVPRIEITSPGEPIYELGSVLLAQYSCVNAITCTGDVPNGAALDTTTPGYHTFTVTATDAAGNTTTATVTFAVSLGSCVPPFEGATVWLPGDGTAAERITHTFAAWTGTPAYAAGRVGQGFAVTPGNSVSLPLQHTGAFTLQAWVATPNEMQPEGTGIVSTGGTGDLATSWQLDLDGVGNYRLTTGNATLSLFIGPARSVFQHVAVTFDGTLITTYLNGQIVESAAWPGSAGLGFQILTLGLDRDGTRAFTGIIDEVQLFDRALSDVEVQQAFLAGTAGLCKNRPPVAAAVATPNPAEATRPEGADVLLDGTGSSDPDHDTLTYTWAEGGTPLGTASRLAVLLSLGSHTVTLTVDDGQGKTNSSTIVVVVRDTTPPVLALPAAVIAEATGPSGTTVSYSASATDIVSGSVPIVCVPASGSAFALGTTQVSCSAVDAADNRTTGTFDVIVQDTVPPVAQITSPTRDVLLFGASVDIALDASDIVGIVSVTVNGVTATMTTGTAQAGTWRATVPIALPVAPGGALRFDAVAIDASGNRGAAGLGIDNDGIPSALDRDRTSGADQSSVYSNDFNNGITAGTLTRNGWTAVLSNVGTAGSVRAQISGAGAIAKIGACAGAFKEVRLDAAGETADITCNPSTGTITVRALSARPWIDVWKRLSNNVWLVAQLPTGATYQTGSPATASPSNRKPIDVRVVRVGDDGATTAVGGFRLGPGESVDVSVTPGVDGHDEQIRFKVLRGRVRFRLRGHF